MQASGLCKKEKYGGSLKLIISRDNVQSNLKCFDDIIILLLFSGLYLVQGSKSGPASFTFFDDICFSTGDDRINNFYAIHAAEWGVVFVASANSIEVKI